MTSKHLQGPPHGWAQLLDSFRTSVGMFLSRTPVKRIVQASP